MQSTQSKPLFGKTAIVTGSSRGIGAAIAKHLAEDGADVVVHYANDEKSASVTANAIAQKGRTAWIIQADLATSDGVPRLLDALPFSQFDILVNNAGIISYSGIGDTKEAEIDLILAVNVRSVYMLIQHAQRRMNDGGRIINISSGASRLYFPSIPVYAALKGFMDVITRHAAPVFAARNITVNSVAPGVTDTDMSAWIHQPGGLDTLKQTQALDGIGKPEYIAGMVACLAGPEGKWITGQVIDVSVELKL